MAAIKYLTVHHYTYRHLGCLILVGQVSRLTLFSIFFHIRDLRTLYLLYAICQQFQVSFLGSLLQLLMHISKNSTFPFKLWGADGIDLLTQRMMFDGSIFYASESCCEKIDLRSSPTALKSLPVAYLLTTLWTFSNLMFTEECFWNIRRSCNMFLRS